MLPNSRPSEQVEAEIFSTLLKHYISELLLTFGRFSGDFLRNDVYLHNSNVLNLNLTEFVRFVRRRSYLSGFCLVLEEVDFFVRGMLAASSAFRIYVKDYKLSEVTL